MESHQVMLLLGCNLGDRAAVFAAARLRIGETVGPLVAVSREYETEPWGTFAAGERQFPFLNQAVPGKHLPPQGGILNFRQFPHLHRCSGFTGEFPAEAAVPVAHAGVHPAQSLPGGGEQFDFFIHSGTAPDC